MHKVFCASIALLLLFSKAAHGMTSTNYGIDFDSLNSGGDDIGTSTNYRIQDTVGEQAVGPGTSTNYGLQAGYRQPNVVIPTMSFDIGTQENETETAFSAFSSSTLTVTVASTASFATGTFIGVVENKGLSQQIAIGRIVSMAGGLITVDAWDGDPASISSVPADGDDFVYRLEGDAAALGALTPSTGATSITHTDVTTEAAGGYTVYVSSDGGLRSASDTIDDVADAAVSIGSEEYGGRVSGSSTTLAAASGDFPITASEFAIQESSAPATNERVGLVYKASIDGSTPGGSYAQLVYYIVTANF